MTTNNLSAPSAPPAPARPAARHDSPASVHLDAIRGIAAVAVVINHLRPIFFADYAPAARHSALVRLAYAASSFGQPAVTIFFVLSGYLISASVFRSVAQNRWSWAQYALSRLTRLYVVLIPALLLGAFWDNLGLRLFHGSNIYRSVGVYGPFLQIPIRNSLSFPIWLGNLFYCQEILVPRFGSNGPLWSLCNEFWYYVMFPLLLFGMARGISLPRRISHLLAAAMILIFVGKFIAIYFLVWLMGTAVSRLQPIPILRDRRVVLVLLMLSLVGFMAVALGVDDPILHHVLHSAGAIKVLNGFLLAIAFSVGLVTVINGGDLLTIPGYEGYKRAAKFLSGISYTLYLVHFPFLVFLNGLILGSGPQWPIDAGHLGCGLLIVVATLAYTLLVWRLAEANTDRIRRYIASRTGIR